MRVCRQHGDREFVVLDSFGATPHTCAMYSTRSGKCWPATAVCLLYRAGSRKWRLDILAKFARGLVSSGDEPDALALRSLPFTVEPWSRNDEVRVLRIVLFRMVKDLPWSPRILS